MRSSRAAFLAAAAMITAYQAQAVEYGVDCTFPIHHDDFDACDEYKVEFATDRHVVYETHMAACYKRYRPSDGMCDTAEEQRLDMNLRQPRSMINYTETGYKVVKVNDDFMREITQHFESTEQTIEEFLPGYHYTNHWEAPSYLAAVETYHLRNQIRKATQPILEEWTGMELSPSSVFGIRVSSFGSIVIPHLDLLPKVTSAVINVAQEGDDWPMELIGRDGLAVNVTLQPGEMLLYESASIIKGRPFPFKGKMYAELFIHFEPTGRPLNDTTEAYKAKLHDFLPPYLKPGTKWANRWHKDNPKGWQKPTTLQSSQLAAAIGDLDRLKEIARENPAKLQEPDELGWQAIHEAARFGHTDILEFLIQDGGVDKNLRTGKNGDGPSPLYLALRTQGADSPVAKYLQSIGAESVAGTMGGDEL